MAPTPVSPHLAAKILTLQTELDAIWPGWRKKQRFDHLGEGGDQAGYDLKARIKWCLKRLSLLEEGKDWDVMIARDLRNRSQCYAHPVIPATGDAGAEPDRDPASPWLPPAKDGEPETFADMERLVATARPAVGSPE